MLEQLVDIYDVWTVPFWQTPNFIWYTRLFIALCTSGLVTLGAWLVMRRRKAPALPAWQRALDCFDGLNVDTVTTPEQVRMLYGSVMGALRDHIQERYGCELRSCTSTEVVDTLQKCQVSDKVFAAVRAIFETGEQVRFGNIPADSLQMRHHIDDARAFVRETRLDETAMG